jgi:CBS domain-containing protein
MIAVSDHLSAGVVCIGIAYDGGVTEFDPAATVVDVMLRSPKTLAGDATAGEVRGLLENPSVQLVLLADDGVFRAAVGEVPVDAPADAPAREFALAEPPTIIADESAETAFERANAEPLRRLVVLGDGDELLGLVCLNSSRTHFCGGVSR